MSRLGVLAHGGLLFFLVGGLVLASCRSQPMVTPSPIRSPLGAEANRDAILHGLAAHRWQLVSERPGLITARLDKKNVGQHVATVDIPYDDETIAIRYRDSHGLRCEEAAEGCATIHRAYNRWVVQLAKDIEYGVQLVRVDRLGDRAVGSGPR